MKYSKYVIVSGRSSHTIKASTAKEAKEKFNKLFPYANIKFVAKVKIGNKRFKI